MKKYNQKIGEFGEGLARQYLINKGYRIVDSNTKLSYKEIDIIALHGKTLVFVEVKTRTSDKFGRAEESLNGIKVFKIKKGISIYLNRLKWKKNNLYFNDIRLDFVSVNIDKKEKTARIKHFVGIE